MQLMKKLKIILQSNITYIFLCLFLLFFVIVFTKIITYESEFNGNETTIMGIVKNYKITDNKLSILVASKEDIICNYYFKNDNFKTKNLIGSKIILTGNLIIPSQNTIPNTFNYKNYLYNNGMFYTFKIESYKYIESNNIFYIIILKPSKKFNVVCKIFPFSCS